MKVKKEVVVKIVVQILFWLGVACFLVAIIARLAHLALPFALNPMLLTRATWTCLLFVIAIILIWKK